MLGKLYLGLMVLVSGTLLAAIALGGIAGMVGVAIWLMYCAVWFIVFAFFFKFNDRAYTYDLEPVEGVHPFVHSFLAARDDYEVWLARWQLDWVLIGLAAVFFLTLSRRIAEAWMRADARRKARERQERQTRPVPEPSATGSRTPEPCWDPVSEVDPYRAFARKPELDLIQEEMRGHGSDVAAALYATLRFAVGIKRVFPRDFSRPTRSFLGGVPLAQPGFDWPEVSNEKGEAVALSFAGQIDLEDLPDFDLRHLWPACGVLYFFLPDGMHGIRNDEASPECVRYRPPSEGPWADVPPPPSLRPYGYSWREPRRPMGLREAAFGLPEGPHIYPRHDVRLGHVLDPAFHGAGNDAADRYAAEGPGAPARRRLLSGLTGLLGRRMDALFFGPYPPLQPLPERANHSARLQASLDRTHVEKFGKIGPPRPEAPPLDPPVDRPWRPYPAFPGAWMEVDALACAAANHVANSIEAWTEWETARRRGETCLPGDLSRLNPHRAGAVLARPDWRAAWEAAGEGARGEEAGKLAESEAALARGERVSMPHALFGQLHLVHEGEVRALSEMQLEAQSWIARARQGDLADVPSEAERDAFWNWWCGLLLSPRALVIEGSALNSGYEVAAADGLLRDAVVRAAEARLAWSPEAAARVSRDLVEALRRRHVFGVDNVHGRHRIAGDPILIQENALMMMPTHVLLLQLEYDQGMDWSFGDVGVFQYWIRPRDILERRFDRVELTFECS